MGDLPASGTEGKAGSDSWTQHADLPDTLAFMACAGITGEIVCAGGINADTNTAGTSTFVYDPGADSWTQVADMPMDLWGAIWHHTASPIASTRQTNINVVHSGNSVKGVS